MKRNFLYFFLSLVLSTGLFAQDKPKIDIMLLDNQRIADVNVDVEEYSKGLNPLIDLMETDFKDLTEKQAVAVTLVTHKTGVAQVSLKASPKLPKQQEEAFLKKANAIKFANTKIVDMTAVLMLKGKEANPADDFAFETTDQKRMREYTAADMKTMLALNTKWAQEEVLPVLAAFQTMVDDKFAGVKGFGNLVAKTDFSKQQDIYKMTSSNPDYWRAIMEMEPGNQLIPVTKIFMLVSQGELDHATRYAEILGMFSSKSLTTDYLSELQDRIGLFNKQLTAEIGKGITEHDKGNYTKAMAIYDEIIKKYPGSAWALYEHYYSQNALSIEKKAVKADDRKEWDDAKGAIYSHNPLYNMDVRASNGKEAYFMFRRMEIGELFKSKEKRIEDIYAYADIALDLGIYDFAAQLFWISSTYSKDKEKSLNRYLYCLEKLGVKQWKANFNYDFEKVFKDIETEKEKTMKENIAYKDFKD